MPGVLAAVPVLLAPACSREARRRSLRQAGRKHQQSPEGRRDHADRQRKDRARQAGRAKRAASPWAAGNASLICHGTGRTGGHGARRGHDMEVRIHVIALDDDRTGRNRDAAGFRRRAAGCASGPACPSARIAPRARAAPEALVAWHGRPLTGVLDADAQDVARHPERSAQLLGDLDDEGDPGRVGPAAAACVPARPSWGASARSPSFSKWWAEKGDPREPVGPEPRRCPNA